MPRNIADMPPELGDPLVDNIVPGITLDAGRDMDQTPPDEQHSWNNAIVSAEQDMPYEDNVVHLDQHLKTPDPHAEFDRALAAAVQAHNERYL